MAAGGRGHAGRHSGGYVWITVRFVARPYPSASRDGPRNPFRAWLLVTLLAQFALIVTFDVIMVVSRALSGGVWWLGGPVNVTFCMWQPPGWALHSAKRPVSGGTRRDVVPESKTCLVLAGATSSQNEPVLERHHSFAAEVAAKTAQNLATSSHFSTVLGNSQVLRTSGMGTTPM